MAAGFRVYQRGEDDQAKAAELLRTLFELVFAIHAPVGAAEFMQEATRET